MGKMLDAILSKSVAHTLEQSNDGFLIIRRPGQILAFDTLVREITDHAGGEYAAFPIADQQNPTSYERIYLIPME